VSADPARAEPTVRRHATPRIQIGAARGAAPGPRGSLLAGSLFQLRRDPLATLLDGARRFGDVVQFRFGPALAHVLGHLVAHPDGIKRVLEENVHNYVKGHTNEPVRAVVGDGLFTSEGELWLRQRRIVQPTFRHQHLERFAGVMTGTATAMLDGWDGRHERTGVIDLAAEMNRLTVTVAARTLFSADLTRDAPAVGRTVIELDHEAMRRVRSILFWIVGTAIDRLPLPANRRYGEGVRRLERVVYRLIAERRSGGSEHDDLLGILMAARDEESGAGMSDRQVRDEVMTFLLAGYMTTANALSWTWYLLARHPEVVARLEDEVEQVAGGRLPGHGDLSRLPYVTAVARESLRLYPPAWLFEREAVADDQIGGFRIPAGSVVLVSPFVTHRHPAFWDDPERFDPERFTAERTAPRPKHAYLPFGAGRRSCIGSAFALMELVLVVATIAQRYRLQLASDEPVELAPLMTLRPRGSIPVRLRPRRR
jgi:cytochrome P450